MNTKDKEIRDALTSREYGILFKLVMVRHKSEKDMDDTVHDYQMKTVCAALNPNSMNENIDFNIPLTDTNIGVTEFQTSDFTIWINFRLFFMSIGEGNGILCEEESIPGWIYHFGVDFAKTNTKWYVDIACINIPKNSSFSSDTRTRQTASHR
jgi:hypothetical protein